MKAKHKDALLLFRVGDFYETFGEDAIKTSQALGIVLTARNNGGSNIELAGFPYHSLDLYLPKLVKSGYRVAICEQLEKPSKEKKLVDRGITDVITPGIGTSDNLLEQKENNFLCAIHFDKEDHLGCAFIDLSTGEFLAYEGTLSAVQKLLGTYLPKEIIYNKKYSTEIKDLTQDAYYTYSVEEWIWQYDYCYEKLKELFKVQNLKGYGIESFTAGQIAAGAIIHYIESTENRQLSHINKISRIQLDQFVWLDQFTIRNLELIYSNHPSGIPLSYILDQTVTAMGARLLRKWILMPLTDVAQIQNRLEIVAILKEHQLLSDELDAKLKGVSDLERIIGKVALGKVTPREVYQLKESLSRIPDIKEIFEEQENPSLYNLLSQLNPLPDVVEKIRKSIKQDPPVNLNKGGAIASGYNPELDELRDLINNSKGHLENLLLKETQKTGITNLKVGFNNVFGYYFEVTNRYKDHNLIPEGWTRKQTLTNAERYISEELKELESKILGAEDKIIALEDVIFREVIAWLATYTKSIQDNALLLAQIDCLNSFAKLARRNQYCKPNINQSNRLHIIEGRHPVIEASLPLGESYIPNDLTIDNEEEQILLITGPNMSGKSAILRQTALICLMAQIGCFVPATSAEIGIIDRIFTRVGASDNISSGESTFMVEMIETASIMNNLSSRSLILLDEIGRGTSTYDGISIAWSIVEYLHEHQSKPKTLFATHYHELSQLADKYGNIENYNVATKEIGERIIFLRKLVKGSTNQSFGIQVAMMSGLPREIILRAGTILSSLQENSVEHDTKKKSTLDNLEKPVNTSQQLSMFNTNPHLLQIEKDLKSIDINALTPIECMIKLSELIKRVS